MPVTRSVPSDAVVVLLLCFLVLFLSVMILPILLQRFKCVVSALVDVYEQAAAAASLAEERPFSTIIAYRS